MKEPVKKRSLTPLDDLFRTDAERADESAERVTTLPLSQLRFFKNHPFQVRDDEEMQALTESVQQFGVLLPILVRQVGDDVYEIISGHRRHHASELAGLSDIPVIVRNLTDDEAIILMVDSNLQREKLLPSEKAFAYKMKLDAMKRQGKRTDLTCAQVAHKSDKRKSRDILAEETGESKDQIRRYIRLTFLLPALLDLTDKGKLAFNPAVEVSYLRSDEQTALYEIMERDETAPSLKQAQRMKQYSKDGTLTEAVIDAIMSEEKPIESKVVLQGKKLQKYFPPSYTPRQMEDQIIRLLENWHRRMHEQSR